MRLSEAGQGIKSELSAAQQHAQKSLQISEHVKVANRGLVSGKVTLVSVLADSNTDRPLRHSGSYLTQETHR
jgi:hypothetical protein